MKSNGSTFDVVEAVTLPNGADATTLTTWDSATLLPIHYTLHQGSDVLDARISPTSIQFTSVPVAYTPLGGTKYMLPYEGLNAFRMMLPFVIAAHPGASFTVAYFTGFAAERAGRGSAAPQTGGPPGDTVAMVALGSERIAAWYNPHTDVLDRENVMPSDARMQLVRYRPH